MIFQFQCYSHLVVVDNVELVVCALQKKKEKTRSANEKALKSTPPQALFVLITYQSAITLRPLLCEVNKRLSLCHCPRSWVGHTGQQGNILSSKAGGKKNCDFGEFDKERIVMARRLSQNGRIAVFVECL